MDTTKKRDLVKAKVEDQPKSISNLEAASHFLAHQFAEHHSRPSHAALSSRVTKIKEALMKLLGRKAA